MYENEEDIDFKNYYSRYNPIEKPLTDKDKEAILEGLIDHFKPLAVKSENSTEFTNSPSTVTETKWQFPTFAPTTSESSQNNIVRINNESPTQRSKKESKAKVAVKKIGQYNKSLIETRQREMNNIPQVDPKANKFVRALQSAWRYISKAGTMIGTMPIRSV